MGCTNKMEKPFFRAGPKAPLWIKPIGSNPLDNGLQKNSNKLPERNKKKKI